MVSADTMPPLPSTAMEARDPWGGPESLLFYSADQMHAYARAYAAEQTRELVEALAELADANSALNARIWPGGAAEYAQQRDRMRAAWVSARALIAKHKGQA